MKTLSPLVFIALCCGACGSGAPVQTGSHHSQATTQSVIQPIEGLEIKPREFQVSAVAASTIELPNGGEISFPANAFVDANGKPVSGTVTVEWQEYHSLADIMVSGIPMDYDSAGVQNHFVSGGMFTIDAHQNGKDIELAQGKEATVALATFDEQRQFNFYSLDDKTGKWSYENTALSTPNPEVAKAKTDSNLPADKAGKAKEELPIFLDLNAKINSDSFPELAGKDIVGWNVDRKLLSKKDQQLLSQYTWNASVTEKTGKNYELSLSTKKDHLILIATPVTMDDALANSKTVEKRTEQRWGDLLAFQQQEKEAKMLRTASIPGFGTYNWDIIHQRETPVQFALNLKTPDGHDINKAEIYHVCPDERSIVHYSPDSFDKFSFDPHKGNCIVAIFPDKSVCTVSDKQFDDARAKGSVQEFTFDMQSRPERFNSGAQLGRLVNKLI